MKSLIVLFAISYATPINLKDEILTKLVQERYPEKTQLNAEDMTSLLIDYHKRLDLIQPQKLTRNGAKSAVLNSVSVGGGVSGSNNLLINGNTGHVTNNFYYLQIGENRADLEHLIKLIMSLTQQEESEEELVMMVNDVLDIANQHGMEEEEYEYETEPISSTSETYTATSITKPSIKHENELYETETVIETTQLPKLSTTKQTTESESTTTSSTTTTTKKTTTSTITTTSTRTSSSTTTTSTTMSTSTTTTTTSSTTSKTTTTSSSTTTTRTSLEATTTITSSTTTTTPTTTKTTTTTTTTTSTTTPTNKSSSTTTTTTSSTTTTKTTISSTTKTTSTMINSLTVAEKTNIPFSVTSSNFISTPKMNLSLLEDIQLKMPKPTDRLCPTCKSSSSLAACFKKQQICSPNQVCDIELRSRSGKIETITMGCKQKSACENQITQNDDQCKPYKKRGPSVCRTCCNGNKCFTDLAELSERQFRHKVWNWAKLF